MSARFFYEFGTEKWHGKLPSGHLILEKLFPFLYISYRFENMKKVLPLLLFILSLPSFAYSQVPSSCPAVSVNGPAGTPVGDRVPFFLSIGTEIDLYQPTYRWSASNGEVIVGKDNKTIEVIGANLISKSLTVTVEIDGLPLGCPSKASETMAYDPPLKASKLAEIIGSLAKVPNARYDEILFDLTQNPAASLYIFISPGKTGSTSIKRKKSDLLNQFSSRTFRSVLHNGSRIIFVDSDKNDDKVVFWLVPAGADNPTP